MTEYKKVTYKHLKTGQQIHGMEQLEEEKKARECFIDSFAESIMKNAAPYLLD